MKAFIISDGDFQTEAFRRVESHVKRRLRGQNADIEEKRIGRGELAYCMGCFGCWIKKPGECVIGDAMSAINRSAMTSDVVFYLSPIVFGQFSANIKNAVDRWLPNILPFFEIRPDGSTMHPPRYATYPKTVMIGYGDDLTEEDTRLFSDITKKHRRNVDVVVYNGDDGQFDMELGAVSLLRVGGEL
jgi:hypothetical protein